MYKSIIKTLIMCALINCTFVYSKEAVIESAQTKKEELSTDYYISHIITGSAAHFSYLASIIIGYITGQIAMKIGVADGIGRCMGLTPQGFKCSDGRVIGTVMGAPALLGGISGLFIIYKTPQWTDRYHLKNKKERSLKQNIFVFFNRILLPYPFGILTGEYFMH